MTSSDEDATKNGPDCERCDSHREYTLIAEIVHNLPYLGMLLLGAAVLLIGLGLSLWGWVAAGSYIAYGVFGALWVILLVCPYCRYHGTRSCPCGYGRIAAKLRPSRAEDRFAEKFKRHIPVIFPLWIVPTLAGAALMPWQFTWYLAASLIAFVLDAFILLPLISIKYGCAGCPQRDRCPWITWPR